MRQPQTGLEARSGFSLIEVIGVLAIIAILSSILAPNVIRSMDRAAVRAERENLQALGGQVKLFLRENMAPPSMTDWATELAGFSDLNPTDLTTNRRGVNRIFVLDGATNPAPRAMIISSMRQGLSLPNANRFRNATRFEEVWNTPEGEIPPTSTWNGWNRWANVDDSNDFLVIERINLTPVYATEFRSFTVTLNNLGTELVRYRLTDAAGNSGPAIPIAAGASVVLSDLYARSRVDLYGPGASSLLAYSYVLSDSGKTIDFDGTQWLPQ